MSIFLSRYRWSLAIVLNPESIIIPRKEKVE